MVTLATVKARGAQVHASVLEHLISAYFPSQQQARQINENPLADMSQATKEGGQVGVRTYFFLNVAHVH